VRPWIWLVLAFLSASFILVNKGDMFSLASDIEDHVRVIPVWIAAAGLFYVVLGRFFKERLSDRSKLLYWSTVGLCSLVHWSLIKFDPHPYSGPVDSVMKRDLLEQSAATDAMEQEHGSPDSTIMYVYSVDTAENGVYMWLSGQKFLLRKFRNGDHAMRSDLDKEAIQELRDTLETQ